MLLAFGLVGALALAGCATVRPTAFPIGSRILPPKSANAEVQVFRDAVPARAYEPIARLNVHMEKTFFIPSAFDDALPQLENLAREHGADALVDIKEKKSRLNETFIYNVSATAIVFRD